jgi:hypothetical protein
MPAMGSTHAAACTTAASAPIVQRPKTPPFHSGDTGSNPVGGTGPREPIALFLGSSAGRARDCYSRCPWFESRSGSSSGPRHGPSRRAGRAANAPALKAAGQATGPGVRVPRPPRGAPAMPRPSGRSWRWPTTRPLVGDPGLVPAPVASRRGGRQAAGDRHLRPPLDRHTDGAWKMSWASAQSRSEAGWAASAAGRQHLRLPLGRPTSAGNADEAHLAGRDPSKVEAAGSSPVIRSRRAPGGPYGPRWGNRRARRPLEPEIPGSRPGRGAPAVAVLRA